MSRSAIVVTCASANYFELLKGCILSIREKPQGGDLIIGFLDVGCTTEQLSWIEQHVDRVCQPQWHHDLSMHADVPDHLRGLLARPFLRDYFPGYSPYIWLDADAWLQDMEALRLLELGATSRRGLAIVPEIDRGSLRQYGGLPEYWRLSESWYTKAFGAELGRRLGNYPMLNAGVYAMDSSAPQWRLWQEVLADGLPAHCGIMTDQLALNVVVYTRGVFERTEMLPAWCNWTCHNGFPKWDVGRKMLIEPYLPHTPIGICHLTTRNKSAVRELSTLEGGSIRVKATYPPNVESA